MKDKKQLLDLIEDDIKSLGLEEEEKIRLLENFKILRTRPVNILVTGATGSGKSSTINALFCSEVCKVGVGVDAETKEIQKFKLANLILWDSPGFGESDEADKESERKIIELLNEVDENDCYKIDLVMVVVDGSSKDFGTVFRLINQIIIPNLGEGGRDRILVVINQSDVALKGQHWNAKDNIPEPVLLDFLENKAASVRERILKDTGVDIQPIYYSAGYKPDGERQRPAYNLPSLIYYIIEHMPREKRVAFAHYVKEQKILPEETATEIYQKAAAEVIREDILPEVKPVENILPEEKPVEEPIPEAKPMKEILQPEEPVKPHVPKERPAADIFHSDLMSELDQLLGM